MDALVTSIKAVIGAAASKTRDFGGLPYPFSYTKAVNFTFGTAASQANQLFDDYRTLAPSANEDLDLAGTLLNAFGETVTFARLKLIYVENTSDTETITVGGAAANALASLFGAVNDVIKVPPGAFFMVCAPDATAYPVTAGTADLLRIANTGGGTTTYRLVLIGATA